MLSIAVLISSCNPCIGARLPSNSYFQTGTSGKW
jgi:hypothetical protein